MRPANTSKWIYEERMAGTFYLEFGIYFILSFEAEALGLFEYSYDFLDEEIPLLEAGEKRYQYAFAYKPEEGEQVRIIDEDSDSNNGITMKIPDSILALSYVDLNTGVLGSEPYGYDKYSITFSNPNFSIDKNGIISVNVPEGVQYMECDVTITWLYGKLAFSKYDMTVTVPMVWTNLSDKELNEYFTASVRVGNDKDGYQTVWNKRVKKNQEFDLPTIETVKKLINYDSYDNGSGINMKYASFSGYDIEGTKNIKIFTDTVYDIQATYRDYSITVTGIEQANGTKISKTYTTQYGKTFDFSDLANTGTSKSGVTLEDTVFTKFVTLIAEKAPEDIGKGELSTYDLTAPVEGKLTLAIDANKVKPVAGYANDAVLATFRFDGITHEDVIQKIRKGTEPNLVPIDAIVYDQGMAIKEISPGLGKVFANTTFTVICGELTGPKVTISFEENGGSEVDDITKVVGSIIGSLPSPTKEGYSFDGWYTDKDLTTAFVENRMPSENITLYAKWMVNTYNVTLNANGGTFGGDENTKVISVTYSSPYGELPTPTRSGRGFAGWFTEPEGGIEIMADTIVEIADNHTLYARWKDLETISSDVFIFTTVTETYQKGVGVSAIYEKNEAYADIDGFTFEYRWQKDPNAVIDVPVNAGTYDMIIKRAADNTYAQFEHRYTSVVVINKAERNLDVVPLDVNRKGYTFLDLKPADGAIDDLSSEAKFTYNAIKIVGNLLLPGDSGSSKPGESYIDGLMPGTDYYVTIAVQGDPNYLDATSKGFVVPTLPVPTESWRDYVEDFVQDGDTIYISTAGQFAKLAKDINDGDLDSKGLNVILTDDIDLVGYEWEPVGKLINPLSDYRPFEGTFDGAGHTIRGLYADAKDHYEYYGLFCMVNNGTIKNLIIEESYIKGSMYIGGIAGIIYGNSLIENCISNVTVNADAISGGIVGTIRSSSMVINCVNYSNVKSNYAGGIAGEVELSNNTLGVGNCINYGNITGEISVGGIVGRQLRGVIINNANFGNIVGTSANTGGIVGENDGKNAIVYNCYTAGTVKGSGKYVGAVVGRNNDDDGKVKYCYYLAGSATCDGKGRNGLGTSSGSVTDGDKDYEVASFTSPESALSRDCGFGDENLISALNACFEYYLIFEDYISEWVESLDGYPIPAGLPER